MIGSQQNLLYFSNCFFIFFIIFHLLSVSQGQENDSLRSYGTCKRDCEYHRRRKHDSDHRARFKYRCNEFWGQDQINCLNSCSGCPTFICDPRADPNLYHCPCKAYTWPLSGSPDSNDCDHLAKGSSADHKSEEMSVIHIVIIINVVIIVVILCVGICIYLGMRNRTGQRGPMSPNDQMESYIGGTGTEVGTGTGMASTTSSYMGDEGEGGASSPFVGPSSGIVQNQLVTIQISQVSTSALIFNQNTGAT